MPPNLQDPNPERSSKGSSKRDAAPPGTFEASALAIKDSDKAAAAALVRWMGLLWRLRGFDHEWLAATARRPGSGKEGAEERPNHGQVWKSRSVILG